MVFTTMELILGVPIFNVYIIKYKAQDLTNLIFYLGDGLVKFANKFSFI